MRASWMTAAALAASALLAGGASARDIKAPAPVAAETTDARTLRTEIEWRLAAAIAASKMAEIQRAEDSRFLWANEAKAACGIADGFLKSNTIEPDSVGRCYAFTAQLYIWLPATAA
ncbi:hypothetical protein [Sphingomonas solaris]|uniref:UrcA family protein n=1 Tax=Alterirhizorhabdus solaris TaxID=2529389 RepID=A0A558QZB9_9SPHN|nr:hypothetical protein [Sphingomonas solaris]TVV72438.1 hypothetical protein FOY91_14625 [Sphingomonas solaris]